MKQKAHYEVQVKIVKYKNANEIEYESFSKEFFSAKLLDARGEAFEYYQDRINDLLQSKGLVYKNDRQARKDLHSFFDPRNEHIVNFGDTQFSSTDETSIWVVFFMDLDIDKNENHIIPYLLNEDMTDEKREYWQNYWYQEKINDSRLKIHGIGNVNPDHLIRDLTTEYTYYIENGIDTGDKNREIEMISGYDGVLENCEILETPFDWTGFDEPWWPIEESMLFEEIISGGEGKQVEFKPSLLYNFSTKKAGISIKHIIAKVICSFLNSKGGYLFIGVSDSKEIQGLDFDFSLSGDKDPKDFFKLEFDELIFQFLSKIYFDLVELHFSTIDEKIIAVIKVEPSPNPVFIKSQGTKEFWIRSQGGTHQVTDIEEIVRYCRNHWEKNVL